MHTRAGTVELDFQRASHCVEDAHFVVLAARYDFGAICGKLAIAVQWLL